jgi:hypothetical protein
MKETTTIIKPLLNDKRTVEERIQQHIADMNNLGDREAARKRKEEGTLEFYQEDTKEQMFI